MGYRVDEVVGRKTNTSLFYGIVFRTKTTDTRFISDIRVYDNDAYQEDVSLLGELPYVKRDHLEAGLEKIESEHRFGRFFDRLWFLTKFLAKKLGSVEKNWHRLLVDIGYVGFEDVSGAGLFISKRNPCLLILDVKYITEIDVLPLQKYRTDPRLRIRDDVERKVKKLQTKRRRIAKKERPSYGKKKDTIRSIAGMIMAMHVGGDL